MKIDLHTIPPTINDIEKLIESSKYEISQEQHYGKLISYIIGFSVAIIVYSLFQSIVFYSNSEPKILNYLFLVCLSLIPGIMAFNFRLAFGEEKKFQHKNIIISLQSAPEHITKSLSIWFKYFDYLETYMKTLNAENRKLMICEAEWMQRQGFAQINDH
jgi:hypothetical protein